MMRPTRHQMFADFARTAALRSICGRLIQVGCIITNMSGTNIKSIGYNGPARGKSHSCGGSPDSTIKCSCIHAEANALVKAPYGPRLRLYTTLSPCPSCADLILNSTVSEVVFLEEYRNPEGIRTLLQGGISVFGLGDDGELYEVDRDFFLQSGGSNG